MLLPQSSEVSAAFIEYAASISNFLSGTTYCQVRSRHTPQHLHAMLKMLDVVLCSFLQLSWCAV